MSKYLIGILPLLMIPFMISSQNFYNGVHISNRDNQKYTITYIESGTLSTRICSCIKPTASMKNGLVPARMRTNVKGFKVLRIKELPDFRTEITAVIDPLTSVDCLAVQADFITVEGIGTFKITKSQSIIINYHKVIMK
jgi:hypothetical protein